MIRSILSYLYSAVFQPPKNIDAILGTFTHTLADLEDLRSRNVVAIATNNFKIDVLSVTNIALEDERAKAEAVHAKIAALVAA